MYLFSFLPFKKTNLNKSNINQKNMTFQTRCVAIRGRILTLAYFTKWLKPK